jgi:arsenate reductase
MKVMDEVGIDISNQRSKGIETYLGKVLFQYLITVCDDADKNYPTVWPGVSNRMHWSFEDPARFEGTEEEKLAKFREVRDLIETRIKEWIAQQS